MSDSFLHNHQSALDSQREDDAIRDLQDSGIYPDPGTNPCETIDIDTLREYMHQDLQETVEKEIRNSSKSYTLDNILENYICSCSDQEVKDYLTEYDRIGDILQSEAEEDYDPTPYYLYDDTFGERPISSGERHRAAFEQKLRDKG